MTGIHSRNRPRYTAGMSPPIKPASGRKIITKRRVYGGIVFLNRSPVDFDYGSIEFFSIAIHGNNGQSGFIAKPLHYQGGIAIC